MQALTALIGPELQQLLDASVHMDALQVRRDGLDEWEDYLRQRVENDESLDRSEREQIVLARRGQGRFRANVGQIETYCRITKVVRGEHLRASHIMPWRDCQTTGARLDGENGLLLTPSVDHLFDRGFISFEDSGQLLVSPRADSDSLARMGIPEQGSPCGSFTSGQKKYLDYHRESVFLCASLGS